MSQWGKIFFWSSVLTLPLLFVKRKPGVVEPGPEADAGDGETIVIEPSEPPEPFPMETMPAAFKNFRPPPMIGYARMRSADVPAVAFPLLRPLLSGELGTITQLPVPGRDIKAVIEPHYHEPGGPVKPWGWHKGVSLWERKGQLA